MTKQDAENLTYIAQHRDTLKPREIADILKSKLPQIFWHIYNQEPLLYDDLKRISKANKSGLYMPKSSRGLDKVTIVNISLKDELKKAIDWPSVFDAADDAGYLKYSFPRGKKEVLVLNKLETGSNVINSIVSHYSNGCNYDVLFSPIFSLIRLDTRFSSVSKRMFNDETFLITLNALSRKYFPLIVSLSKEFKKYSLSRRFNRLVTIMSVKGLPQSEIYIIQKCFIESFLNGIHKQDDYDVTTEYRAAEELYNLHCTDGSSYLLEWFNPLQP